MATDSSTRLSWRFSASADATMAAPGEAGSHRHWPAACDAGQVRACVRRAGEMNSQTHAKYTPPGTHGPAATPDHPCFPSVRATQDMRRCSGRRIVALDLLFVELGDARHAGPMLHDYPRIGDCSVLASAEVKDSRFLSIAKHDRSDKNCGGRCGDARGNNEGPAHLRGNPRQQCSANQAKEQCAAAGERQRKR